MSHRTPEEIVSEIDLDGLVSGIAEEVQNRLPPADAPGSYTIDVPGDYPTVKAACDHIDDQPAAHGSRITINIEEGHEIQTFVAKRQRNYRNVLITSEDDELFLAPSFPNRNVFQYHHHSVAPTFDILINGEGHGQRAYQIIFNSSVHFRDGAGATNFDVNVSIAQNSKAFGDHCIFTDAERRGATIVNNSRALFHNTRFDRAGHFGLRVSMSRVDAILGSMTECGRNAIRANQRADVQARASDVSDSAIGVYENYRASVTAEDLTAHNIGGNVILCSQSDGAFSGLDVDGSGSHAVVSQRGSDVYMSGSLSGVGGNDAHVRHGGKIADGNGAVSSSNIPLNTIRGEGVIFQE